MTDIFMDDSMDSYMYIVSVQLRCSYVASLA